MKLISITREVLWRNCKSQALYFILNQTDKYLSQQVAVCTKLGPGCGSFIVQPYNIPTNNICVRAGEKGRAGGNCFTDRKDIDRCTEAFWNKNGAASTETTDAAL